MSVLNVKNEEKFMGKNLWFGKHLVLCLLGTALFSFGCGSASGGGDAGCTEGETKCEDNSVLSCSGGNWEVYSDCAVQGF